MAWTLQRWCYFFSIASHQEAHTVRLPTIGEGGVHQNGSFPLLWLIICVATKITFAQISFSSNQAFITPFHPSCSCQGHQWPTGCQIQPFFSPLLSWPISDTDSWILFSLGIQDSAVHVLLLHRQCCVLPKLSLLHSSSYKWDLSWILDIASNLFPFYSRFPQPILNTSARESLLKYKSDHTTSQYTKTSKWLSISSFQNPKSYPWSWNL
jgi:hypothetical protein